MNLDPELAHFRTREAWEAYTAAVETRRILADLERAKEEYDRALAKLQEVLAALTMHSESRSRDRGPGRQLD